MYGAFRLYRWVLTYKLKGSYHTRLPSVWPCRLSVGSASYQLAHSQLNSLYVMRHANDIRYQALSLCNIEKVGVVWGRGYKLLTWSFFWSNKCSHHYCPTVQYSFLLIVLSLGVHYRETTCFGGLKLIGSECTHMEISAYGMYIVHKYYAWCACARGSVCYWGFQVGCLSQLNACVRSKMLKCGLNGSIIGGGAWSSGSHGTEKQLNIYTACMSNRVYAKHKGNK